MVAVTLMMEAICSSKMPVLTTAIWHNIPKNGILHSHQNENLKSYKIISLFLSYQKYMKSSHRNWQTHVTQCHNTMLIFLTLIIEHLAFSVNTKTTASNMASHFHLQKQKEFFNSVLPIKQANSVALSPRATSTCQWNLVQLFWIEGCCMVSAADPLRS
jgi:hypothetical protein